MSILYQAIGSFILCNLCLLIGIIYAWPSCTLKIFESANTTLHRPMGETELALFGSLSSIGALFGVPLVGFSLDRIGRKYCAVGISLITVVAWSLLAFCNQVEVILTAVFISGFGGASFLLVPFYIGEISQESIRGTLTAGGVLFYGIGVLLSYILGGYLEYKVMIYVCLTMSVISVGLLSFVKESPVYLMKNGLEEEAKKSIAFYRNVKPNSKEVMLEIDTLHRSFNPNFDDESTPETEKLNPKERSTEKLSLWVFIKKSRSTRRAMYMTLILMTASIFQGLVVVQVYAEPLFEETVPTLSATISCVLLAVVMVVAAIIGAYLTDKAGRRPLLIYSSVAAGVCCLLLGTQLQWHWGPHWLSAILIYLYCSVYTFGAGTVPYVLVAEVFLPEVKSFMTTLVIEWAWLCNFVILFVFNPLVSAMGLGPVFYLFAAVCFGTAVFTFWKQPETNGLPVDIIQTLFMGRKACKTNSLKA